MRKQTKIFDPLAPWSGELRDAWDNMIDWSAIRVPTENFDERLDWAQKESGGDYGFYFEYDLRDQVKWRTPGRLVVVDENKLIEYVLSIVCFWVEETDGIHLGVFQMLDSTFDTVEQTRAHCDTHFGYHLDHHAQIVVTDMTMYAAFCLRIS